MMQTQKRKTLGGLAGTLLLVAWGCTAGESDLGSNKGGGAGGSGADDGTGAHDGTGGTSGGSDSMQGGASHGGSEVAAGRANGGRAGGADPGAGAAPLSGGSGGTDAGAPGSGGSAGTPACDCPYPPILGGDCCTARDACETDGVGCELLRSSIRALRAAGAPGRSDSPEGEAYYDCVSTLSAALVERCAFVEPECGEPAEDYATFGDPGEEGYSECSESETREALRCGEPGSYYGPDCCQRQRCLEDSECASGRCIYRRVQAAELRPEGYPHMTECALLEQGCHCGGIEAGEPHNGYCIGEDEDLERFDCEVESKTCAELLDWDETLLETLTFEEPRASRAVEAYWSCEMKISDELAERCERSDCRETGCRANYTCTACSDPAAETYWFCLDQNATCAALMGQAGAGNSD
jgi:hypothetical protein